MLEGLHSYGCYAQELYLIGNLKDQDHDAGSNRQPDSEKVPFTLAKWLFDTGDRARLTTGMPP